MSKTKKMKFSEDKFVDGKLTFPKGKVCDVAVESVDRWIKRGGVVVDGDEKDDTTEEPKKEFNKLAKPIEAHTAEELEEHYTVKELQEFCDLEGHTEYTQGMKKAELIEAMLDGSLVPADDDDL